MFNPRGKYDDCFRYEESKYDRCLKKLIKTDMEVEVSSIQNTERKQLQQLIKDAQQVGKSVIFTFTPGPFKSAEELPNDWMNVNPLVGCSAQLNAFEKAFKDLNAVVINVNTQKSSYQQGENGLLAVKKLSDLLMISDANGQLRNALGLFSLTLPDSRYENDKYLERFTIVIKPNNEAKVFEISSPVNDLKANIHVDAVKQFINPELKLQPEERSNSPVHQ